MSRIALISDVHSNLEALRSVLRDVSRVGADVLVCLGDVVGYGPDPRACVEIVWESCDAVIVGNHDEGVRAVRLREPDEAPADALPRVGRFNRRATAAIEFTADAIDLTHERAIGSWPDRVMIEGIEFRHANLGCASGPSRWAYLNTHRAAIESLTGMCTFIGAVGHTHVPSIVACALSDRPELPNIKAMIVPGSARVQLPEGCRVILNPGSVGQPRDGNPEASWGLLDTAGGWFEIHRVAYDVDAVEFKLREAGLPLLLGQRLRIGA